VSFLGYFSAWWGWAWARRARGTGLARGAEWVFFCTAIMVATFGLLLANFLPRSVAQVRL
jgi:hypothetical protein